ncbi:MAG: hypothetical protein WBW14_09485, partial [Candidatus Acidiferrum sp.]
KEQGRLEGRTKSRRFDKYLHGSLPWGIVPVTRVHLYFQRRKAPQARGFAFVINKEHGRGGFWRTERQRDANRRWRVLNVFVIPSTQDSSS